MLVTSEDYLERAGGGPFDASYLNVNTRRGTFSFGPYGKEEDPYELYYRILTAEGPYLCEDCTGQVIPIAIEEVESVSVGERLGSFWED